MSNRILGLVILAIGLLLLAFGFNSSESVADSVSEGVTGRFTDKTMWYLIGGGALAVLGAGLAFFRGGRAHA
ncbi:MAG: DUF3185 family protein [Planctomycetota bacterium]